MKRDKYSRCVVVATPRFDPDAEPPIPAAEQIFIDSKTTQSVNGEEDKVASTDQDSNPDSE